MHTSRFERAIAAIDAANAEDPNTIVVQGELRPKELAHAELMTAWLLRIDAEATEVQRLAARAHHLRRWAVARSSEPDGRAGYLRWRAAQKRRHAEEVGAILRHEGYDEDVVDRVQRLVRKDGLARDRRRSDPQAQAHEDALCLVFLETQLTELAERLGDDKAVDVLRKTITKMSDRAIALALELPLGDDDRRLVTRAAVAPPAAPAT